MIETEFEHYQGLTTDRIDANPAHDGGQTEESLNFVCLKNWKCLLTNNKKNYNTKQKTISDLRNLEIGEIPPTE